MKLGFDVDTDDSAGIGVVIARRTPFPHPVKAVPAHLYLFLLTAISLGPRGIAAQPGDEAGPVAAADLTAAGIDQPDVLVRFRDDQTDKVFAMHWLDGEQLMFSVREPGKPACDVYAGPQIAWIRASASLWSVSEPGIAEMDARLRDGRSSWTLDDSERAALTRAASSADTEGFVVVSGITVLFRKSCTCSGKMAGNTRFGARRGGPTEFPRTTWTPIDPWGSLPCRPMVGGTDTTHRRSNRVKGHLPRGALE